MILLELENYFCYVRLGAAISSIEIAQIFNKTKAPYNVSTPTAALAKSALTLEGISVMQANIKAILKNRTDLINELLALPFTGKVLGHNDANFVLIEILNLENKPCNETAVRIYKELAENRQIVVRYRGSELWCTGCLRITVGTGEENRILISNLKELKM